MGFINRIRMRGQIKEQEMQAHLSELDILNKSFGEATQRFIQPEPDEGSWIKIGEGQHLQEMGASGYDHYEMLKQAYKLWMQNLFARAIVRNLAKFVLGKGPIVKPKSDNQVVKDYWNAFAKANKWGRKEKEMVHRVFRDGELFIRKFPDDDNLKVRFLRADYIRNPNDQNKINNAEKVTYGIGTDPKDVENVKSYYLCDAMGNWKETIPAGEIIHIKILVDSDMKRGMSALLVAMSMLKKYNEWLEDRIVLNKVRSAIALVRKVTGTSSTVDSIRNKQASDQYTADRYKQKAFERGTVITASKGIEYDMLSPKINAPDAANDGRNMLLAVAAGTGLPEMMLTSDWSNANYASSMTAQNPFVREVEDWQDFFEEYYREIFSAVVQQGKDKGKIPGSESDECTLEWPPLILADIQKNNTARQIQHQNKIISKTTWQQKEGLDPEQEKKNLETEQGEDVYKGFNMPTAPVNQFGSTEE
jgi:capsid protein